MSTMSREKHACPFVREPSAHLIFALCEPFVMSNGQKEMRL